MRFISRLILFAGLCRCSIAWAPTLRVTGRFSTTIKSPPSISTKFFPLRAETINRVLLKNTDRDEEYGDSRKFGGRIGGRSRKTKLAKETNRKDGGFPWLPILGSLLAVKILSGIFMDSNLVYYESSVYESRVYDSNGRLETNRKESFRTNIPGIMEQQQLKQLASPEDDIIREMDQMMRRQEAILDQFF